MRAVLMDGGRNLKVDRVRAPSRVALRVIRHGGLAGLADAVRRDRAPGMEDASPEPILEAVTARMNRVDERPSRALVCLEYRLVVACDFAHADTLFDNAIEWVTRRHGAEAFAAALDVRGAHTRTLRAFTVPTERIPPRQNRRRSFAGRNADGSPIIQVNATHIPGFTRLPALASYTIGVIAGIEDDFARDVLEPFGYRAAEAVEDCEAIQFARELYSVLGDHGRVFA